ncbi:MAG: glycosyltransferase [bacterium]|nr:glycosyltransferase [bacterium]
MNPPRKTKILRVIARLNVGGPAIHVILLTAGLDPERYETVLVSGVEGPDEGDMHDLANEKGVEPFILPALGRELNPIRDLATLWKLYRVIRREKPDVVHTHTAKAGTVGRLAAWLAGVPVVIHTFHGHVLHGYFSPWKTELFRSIERFLARRCDKIIAVSESCRQDLLRYGVGDEEKDVTIPLGLELEPFRAEPPESGAALRQQWGIPDGAIAVGMIARMVPIKRHEDLFRAIPAVLECHPGVYFVIVGDGELRPELESLARDLNITHRLVFTGFRDDRARVYQALDLVALTSGNEGLPVAVIEALSSGKPVVATRVGGVPELIEDGVTGFIAEPYNVGSISEAFLRALAEPSLADMGRRAQEETLRKYAVERLIRDLDELYQDLLRKKQGSAAR